MALELDARRIQKLMSFMLIAQSHMSLALDGHRCLWRLE